MAGIANGIRSFLKNGIYTLQSFVGVFLHSHRLYTKQIKNINSHNSKKTIRILGNGESLKNIIDDFQQDSPFEYMVVNRHVLSPTYSVIRPKYYVVADPLFFTNEQELQIIQKIKEDTQWPMYLFIPYTKSNKRFKHYFDGTAITVILYNGYAFRGYGGITRMFYNLNMAMPRVQNVIVACIFLSMKIGFDIIELYGVEHSWTKLLTVNDDNDVCLYNPHFFDKNNVEVRTFKEIHHATSGWRMHEVLRAYAMMFESYWVLRDYADYLHVDIINKTEGSFIDAFRRS